ncbi:MAG: molybdopterin-dependent oxidoreductase, partial [Oleiphilaceae bacterium]|nr:molybdopterin-dependent oxidoreductase [Oleiphilaceae bacterium]
DLYQRCERHRVDQALSKTQALVVLDHQHTETLDRADLALPAASFAEGDGTLVSLEGRAQRFFQVYDPRYMRPESRIHESWRWLHALGASLRREPVTEVLLDEVTRDCATKHPALLGILGAAPGSDFRIDGLQLAREPHRYSGRTSMRANQNVAEPRVPQDQDTAFAFSMEGYSGYDKPRQQVPFAWAPGWNSPSAWNKFTDEVGGHLRGGDPGFRLLEPVPGHYHYHRQIPDAFAAVKGQWRLAVLPRLFGGEETSNRAEPIMERTTPAYLTLSGDDADALGVSDGDPLTLTSNVLSHSLPAKVEPDWPQGLLGLPTGVHPGLVNGLMVELQPAPRSRQQQADTRGGRP